MVEHDSSTDELEDESSNLIVLSLCYVLVTNIVYFCSDYLFALMVCLGGLYFLADLLLHFDRLNWSDRLLNLWVGFGLLLFGLTYALSSNEEVVTFVVLVMIAPLLLYILKYRKELGLSGSDSTDPVEENEQVEVSLDEAVEEPEDRKQSERSGT